MDIPHDVRFSPIHMVVLNLVRDISLDQQINLDHSGINRPDWSGRTLLMWSSMRGDAKAVSTLLRSKANTAITDKQGRTALHHAARRSSLQCTSKLLRADSAALINARDYGGCTPIYWTSTSKEPQAPLVHLLVRSGADIDYPDFQGRTALFRAARLNNPEMVKVFLEKGANVNVRTHSGESPVDAAAIAGNRAMEKTLRRIERRSGVAVRRDSDGEDGLAMFEDPVETFREDIIR